MMPRYSIAEARNHFAGPTAKANKGGVVRLLAGSSTGTGAGLKSISASAFAALVT